MDAIFGEWCFPSCEYLAQACCGSLRQRPQFRIEENGDPPFGLGIENCALRHRPPGHLFETKALGAELHLICAVTLDLASFELDGVRRLSVRARAELDEVGNACHSQAARDERQTHDPTYATGSAGTRLMRRQMQHLAFCSQSVLGPKPFEMDQRRLAEAIDCVVECG